MKVAVRGKVPDNWNADTARHITERLQALERANAGGAPAFLAPVTPTFGTGTVTGGAGAGGSGGGTPAVVSDHGGLTGLADDDHPQYAGAVEAEPHAHKHLAEDVVGLSARYPERGEPVEAHTHGFRDVTGLENEFVRRNEGETGHQHVMADLADVNLAHLLLWQEFYGG